MLELSSIDRKSGETKKEGYIPAVFYGSAVKTTSIFVPEVEFKKVFGKVGESEAFILKTPLEDETALVQDIQLDPVKNTPKHIDFYIIEKGQKVDVKVPLNFIGESPQVKAGNILVKVLHELHIEGEPINLPHALDVDISTLTELSSVIHVKDIKLPEGITLYHVNEEDVIASIAEAKEEVEEVPATIDLESIEVEQKGKKEEEGAPTEGEDVTKAE